MKAKIEVITRQILEVEITDQADSLLKCQNIRNELKSKITPGTSVEANIVAISQH